MALKKSELYSSLWKSCDELRGGMDASQYKDYVLILLFVKYVSDKYAGDPSALIDVPPGGSFADMVALKGRQGNRRQDQQAHRPGWPMPTTASRAPSTWLTSTTKKSSAKARRWWTGSPSWWPSLRGWTLAGNRAEGDDLLGDAYEYLMRHFATESGKSKGQFYTPAEVSRIMAMVIDLAKATSAARAFTTRPVAPGSLLLKAHDEAKSRTGLDLALYGQEMDNATSALARMNMVLHDCPTAEIWQDNVLSSPHFKGNGWWLKTFDFVVANPPFSNKNWTSGLDPLNDLLWPL
jgi:type I restriction enzyme M protein